MNFGIYKGIIWLLAITILLSNIAMAADSTPPTIEDQKERQINNVWVKTIKVSDNESGVERIEILRSGTTNGFIHSTEPASDNNGTSGDSLLGDNQRLKYWANWSNIYPKSVDVNIEYADVHKNITVKIRVRNGDGYWNESTIQNPPAVPKRGYCIACHGVNQLIGAYDTLVNQLAEQNCRNCHASGVPDRHHYLAVNGEYGCDNCHPVQTGTLLFDRNCQMCHNGTAFYANPNLIPGKPHHNTVMAQGRDCKQCHGGYVDNYNDGHYIPTYNKSMVTPDTSYRAINSSSGKKWGGCEACHEAYTNIQPIILSNMNTHHDTIMGVTEHASCDWCHGSGMNVLDIRKCEDCHSVSTLHNIQYNYSQTNGDFGWGHIGNNWDCNGCHASWVAGATITGAIIPDIMSITPSRLISDIPTVVTIDGTNFINDQYSSIVSIDGNRLIPSSLTDNQIVVDIPALSSGVHNIQVIKTGDVTDKPSRLSTLTVVDPVDIISAKISKKVKNLPVEVTITGIGFGPQPDPLYQDLGVWITNNRKSTTTKANIINWTNNKIVVSINSANVKDLITVKALYGQDNTAIGN